MDKYTDNDVMEDLAEELSFNTNGGEILPEHEESAEAIIAIAPIGMVVMGCADVLYEKVGDNHWVHYTR